MKNYKSQPSQWLPSRHSRGELFAFSSQKKKKKTCPAKSHYEAKGSEINGKEGPNKFTVILLQSSVCLPDTTLPENLEFILSPSHACCNNLPIMLELNLAYAVWAFNTVAHVGVSPTIKKDHC